MAVFSKELILYTFVEYYKKMLRDLKIRDINHLRLLVNLII